VTLIPFIVAGLKTGRLNRGINLSLRKLSVSVFLKTQERAGKYIKNMVVRKAIDKFLRSARKLSQI
jgi:hypothetical protein